MVAVAQMLLFSLALLLNYEPTLQQDSNLPFKGAPKEKLPQHFFYDNSGILTINGSVKGMSEPITMGTGPVPKDCIPKQYYKFTICPRDKRKLDAKKVNETPYTCPGGQLREGQVKPNFVLDIVNNDIIRNCDKLFSGFKIATHYFKDQNESYIFDDDKTKVFLEIAPAFTKNPYFFPMPKTKCLDLWMGNEEDLATTVRKIDKKNIIIPFQRVTIKDDDGKEQKMGESMHIYGKNISNANLQEDYYDMFADIPNFNNLENFNESAHIGMLYLDFRPANPMLQQFFTSSPTGAACNLLVRVTSNKVGRCKAQFKQKNFALRAYAWGNTTYALTIESGFEQTQTTGQSTTEEQEDSQSKETGQQSTQEESEMTGLQKESEQVKEVQSTHDESHTSSETVSAGGSAGASGGGGGVSGGLSVGGSYSNSRGSSNSLSEMHARRESKSSSDYSSQSTSSIFTNAYTHTATMTNIASTKTTSSQTVGISTRTVFKWTVTVPPKMVLTPMQMQMNCDGKAVKIPWIKFLLQGEGEEAPITETENEQ